MCAELGGTEGNGEELRSVRQELVSARSQLEESQLEAEMERERLREIEAEAEK